MEDFREHILNLSEKAVRIMDEYFDGKRAGTEKVQEASAMIREGVKISNRDQVDAQVKRSQALKLISFVPAERRDEYISITNPDVKPFLLARPKK
jgi:DNA-directed RNA polymerase alpha subunit